MTCASQKRGAKGSFQAALLERQQPEGRGCRKLFSGCCECSRPPSGYNGAEAVWPA